MITEGVCPHLLASILINGRFARLNQMRPLITHVAHILANLVAMKILSWSAVLDRNFSRTLG